jgi:hypothetical protein
MNTKKLLYALPAVATLVATTLPASADVYYDDYGSYYSTPVYSTPVVTTTPVYSTPVYTNQVLSYPAVVPNTTYVDTDYGYRSSNVLGRTVGGAALGAGVGALGGLIFGAVSGHHRLGRSTLGGTAAGAAIGGALGLFGGLGGGGRSIATPGDYWY